MKNAKNLIILVITLTTIAACTNLERILVFPTGTWNVDQLVKETYISGLGVQNDTTVNDGTITFDKDKTGSYADANGDTGTFSWAYDKEAEVLTVVENGDSLFYDVIENKFNSQTLRSDKITKVLGVEYRNIRTVSISR
jgi:hypothetical protein